MAVVGDGSTTLRWAFNVKTWDVEEGEVARIATALLPAEEVTAVLRFHRLVDRKRTLVGRLMTRHAACTALGIGFTDVLVHRTPTHHKPFVANDVPEHVGWNFNVSHDGDWVVLAADRRSLVGVDVSHIRPPRGESVESFLGHFKTIMSVAEFDTINAAASPLHMFFVHWALKESYIKARGDGLAHADVTTIEFSGVSDGWRDLKVMADDGSFPTPLCTSSWSVAHNGDPVVCHIDVSLLDADHPVSVIRMSHASSVEPLGSLGAPPAEPLSFTTPPAGDTPPFVVLSLADMLAHAPPIPPP